MLGKKKSLRNSLLISSILKKGKTRESKYLRFKFVENHFLGFQSAIIATKKMYKKAVIRNLARRRVRHLVQLANMQQKNLLGVFLFKNDITKTSFERLKEDFFLNFKDL